MGLPNILKSAADAGTGDGSEPFDWGKAAKGAAKATPIGAGISTVGGLYNSMTSNPTQQANAPMSAAPMSAAPAGTVTEGDKSYSPDSVQGMNNSLGLPDWGTMLQKSNAEQASIEPPQDFHNTDGLVSKVKAAISMMA